MINSLIVRKFSIVSMLILSTLMSGCQTYSSALEFQTISDDTTITTTVSTLEEVPTTTTTEISTTTEATTTREHNYQPNMTVCSMYSPEMVTSTVEETTTTSVPLVDSSYLFQDCAFIGDSLTVGLSMYELIPTDHTFAKEGLSISGMNSLQLYTNYGYAYPAQALSYWQPKHLYIMLGINGVSWISNDKAIESYRQLIDTILSYNIASIQDINIISVLPVAYSKEIIDTVDNGRILNSEIDSFNEQLKIMADSYNINYIDANSRLKNLSTGCLPDDLTVDGIHLTKSGYELVVQAILDDVNYRN